MRNDNDLLREANKRIDLEEEQAKTNAKRFKKWAYRWYPLFHKLPKKDKSMNIFRCHCGRKPESRQLQAFNVLRCDECDIQAYDLDYKTCIRKWNRINAPVRIENSPVDALEFFVQQSELA